MDLTNCTYFPALAMNLSSFIVELIYPNTNLRHSTLLMARCEPLRYCCYCHINRSVNIQEQLTFETSAQNNLIKLAVIALVEFELVTILHNIENLLI